MALVVGHVAFDWKSRWKFAASKALLAPTVAGLAATDSVVPAAFRLARKMEWAVSVWPAIPVTQAGPGGTGCSATLHVLAPQSSTWLAGFCTVYACVLTSPSSCNVNS